MIKKVLIELFTQAVHLNHKNIFSLLEFNPHAVVLDVGCDDGKLTLQFAQKIGTKNIYGVDVVKNKLTIAKKRGIKTFIADLNEKLPFENNFFDVITGNQVIEHIAYLDVFMEELYRILKPGGYIIISTENASSWCNIFASIMGWQIFSLTNVSNKANGLGNPLALFRDGDVGHSAWTHKTIFNIRGLKEFIEIHGFKIKNIAGAGYFPLPAILGIIDKNHSHFMTFKAIKK